MQLLIEMFINTWTSSKDSRAPCFLLYGFYSTSVLGVTHKYVCSLSIISLVLILII